MKRKKYASYTCIRWNWSTKYCIILKIPNVCNCALSFFFKQIEIKRKCFIFKTLFWAEYTQTFTYSFIKKTSSFNANQETSISASIIRLWTWTSHIIIILHILSTSYTVPIKEMLNKLTLSFGFLCRLHKLILSVMSWKVCLVYILSHVVTQSIIWIHLGAVL